MILVAAMAVVVVAVWLRGGRLSRLGTLQLRLPGLAIAAVAVQVVLLQALPASTPWGLSVAVHLASYGLALGFVAANRHATGLWVIALGGLLNLAVIAANGGVMPASAAALAAVGRDVDVSTFSNAAPISGAHLGFLGDVVPVPGPYPLGNVVSIGDVLLVAGAALLIHRACVGSGYEPEEAATDPTASSSAGRNRSGRVTHTA